MLKLHRMISQKVELSIAINKVVKMSANWKSIKNNIINTDNKFILAVSGGVDSMFGLNFFKDIKNIDIVVGHFDHKIREDSYKDLELISEYCDNHGIKLEHGFGNNIKNENDARNQRYDFLRRVKEQYNTRYIVTFHHSDDQVETILLNLFRGVSHDNLPIKELGNDLFRPFLKINKDDMIFQAEKRNLKWNEDYTNHENNYDRNWLRNEVIPLICQRRNIKKSLLTGLEKTLMKENL